MLVKVDFSVQKLHIAYHVGHFGFVAEFNRVVKGQKRRNLTQLISVLQDSLCCTIIPWLPQFELEIF
jgi:hypothetical protein